MDQVPSVGKVLISEPFLEDPNFARTVVLLTEHNEEGSVGFVMSQKTDLTVEGLIDDLHGINAPVFQGGPVQLESFHYIHKYSEIEGAVEIHDGLYWSGNFEEVKIGLMSGNLSPDQFIFFIGYSGWAPGQLGMELDEKAWVVGDIDSELLFDRSMSENDLWKTAMISLGGNFAILANSPINPQYN